MIKNIKKIPGSGLANSYSHAERLSAINIFLQTGSVAAMTRATGVSDETFLAWRRSEWFNEIITELRQNKREELDVAFSKIIETATTQMIERLEHGDEMLSGNNVVRVKVKARDLAMIVNTMSDRIERLRASSNDNNKRDANRLDVLRDRLRALNGEVISETVVTDTTATDTSAD